MKKFVMNMLMFALLIPIYMLVLVLWVYNHLIYPIAFLISKTNTEPYEWFDRLDEQIKSIYSNL